MSPSHLKLRHSFEVGAEDNRDFAEWQNLGCPAPPRSATEFWVGLDTFEGNFWRRFERLSNILKVAEAFYEILGQKF